MDIVERLRKNIECAQNGLYVGVKEQRDSWQAAIDEIERLEHELEATEQLATHNYEACEIIMLKLKAAMSVVDAVKAYRDKKKNGGKGNWLIVMHKLDEALKEWEENNAM